MVNVYCTNQPFYFMWRYPKIKRKFVLHKRYLMRYFFKSQRQLTTTWACIQLQETRTWPQVFYVTYNCAQVFRASDFLFIKYFRTSVLLKFSVVKENCKQRPLLHGLLVRLYLSPRLLARKHLLPRIFLCRYLLVSIIFVRSYLLHTLLVRKWLPCYF